MKDSRSHKLRSHGDSDIPTGLSLTAFLCIVSEKERRLKNNPQIPLFDMPSTHLLSGVTPNTEPNPTHGDDNIYRPLDKVPGELWSMIFIECLPIRTSIDPVGKTSITDPRNIPILLTSVCQLWRQVACSTTPLWKKCWLNFVHPVLNHVWLCRAGSQLISIYGSPEKRIDEVLEFGSFLPVRVDWDWFLPSILPFQKRFRSIEMDVSPFNMEPTRVAYRFDAPELETLLMPAESGVTRWLFHLVANAPRLHHLELDQIVIHDKSYNEFRLQLNQQLLPNLTTLRIHDIIFPEDIVQILTELPQLQEFSLCATNDHSDLSDIHATHTSLISLSTEEQHMSDLLTIFTIPSLRAFHCWRCLDVDDLIDFLERSRCLISELGVPYSKYDHGGLVELFRHERVNHWVERLDIKFEDDISPELLGPVSSGSSQDTMLLPHLSQLSLRSNDLSRLSSNFLVELIASRCGTRVCECPECERRLEAKKIQLEQVIVSGFGEHLGVDSAGSFLDVERLVTLTGLKEVQPQDANLVIEFNLNRRYISRDKSSCHDTELPPVKFWFGLSSEGGRGSAASAELWRMRVSRFD